MSTAKDRHRAKAYKKYSFRVRRGSELEALLDDHLTVGQLSLNFFITKLLCEKFDCKLPHRQYNRRFIKTIYTDKEHEHEPRDHHNHQADDHRKQNP